MKKLLMLLMIISIPLLSLGKVDAIDEERDYSFGGFGATATINGVEYPLIYQDPDISTYAETTNGVSYAVWKISNSGSWSGYTPGTSMSVTPNVSTHLVLRFVLPEQIPSGYMVSFDVTFTFASSVKVTPVESRILAPDDLSIVGAISSEGLSRTGGPTTFNVMTTSPLPLNNAGSYVYLYVDFVSTSSSVIFDVSRFRFTSSNGTSLAISARLNEMIPIIQGIESNTGTTVSAINSMNSSISSSIDNLQSYLVSIDDRVGAFKIENNSNLQQILTVLSNFSDKTDLNFHTIQDYLLEGSQDDVSSSSGLTDKSSQLDSTISNYDNLETSITDDFSSSMSNVNKTTSLLGSSDFVRTSTFIRDNILNIYNSHAFIRDFVTYCLVIGLAFTVIGIFVKR